MLRWGWGGVGHVNVRWHLRREVDATFGIGVGWGGVGWGGVGHVNVRWHLRPEVDATLGIRTLDALVEAKETK